MKKLLALAVVGIAVKYLFDSEQGKQLKTKIQDWLKDAQDNYNNKPDTATPKMNP